MHRLDERNHPTRFPYLSAAPGPDRTADRASRDSTRGRYAKNPLAWIAATCAAIAAVLAFDGVPLSWVLPPLVFCAVARVMDVRRRRQEWLASRAAENPQQVASQYGAVHRESPGLTYLADNPERDPAAPKRRSRRMPQEMLFCNLGQVLDLSRGGLRVRLGRNQYPDGVVDIEIHAPDGPLRVTAELVWTKVDQQTRDAGLRFVDLPPDSADRITAICMQHRCQATMSNGARWD